MPTAKESLASHAAKSRIDKLVEYIDSTPLQTDNEDIAAKYARVAKIVKRVQWSLQTCDPDFVFPDNLANALKHIDAYANSVASNLRDFHTQPNPASINSANANANEILRYLHVLQTDATPGEGAQMSEALNHFQHIATASIAEVGRLTQSSKDQLKSLTQAVTSQKERLDQNDKVMEAQKGRLDQAIAEFQKQFTKTEETRRAEFAKAISDQSAAHKAQVASNDEQAVAFLTEKAKELDDLRDGFKTTAKASIDALEARKKEATDLVHVIGNIGVTGNYQQIANSERTEANRLRWIAISLMVFMALGAILTIFWQIDNGLDWKVVTFRLVACLIVGVPAFYAARESDIHRRREQQCRKLELELASVDPYLERLPEDKRQEVKALLAERYFGQPEGSINNRNAVSAGPLFDALKMVLENLTKK